MESTETMAQEATVATETPVSEPEVQQAEAVESEVSTEPQEAPEDPSLKTRRKMDDIVSEVRRTDRAINRSVKLSELATDMRKFSEEGDKLSIEEFNRIRNAQERGNVGELEQTYSARTQAELIRRNSQISELQLLQAQAAEQAGQFQQQQAQQQQAPPVNGGGFQSIEAAAAHYGLDVETMRSFQEKFAAHHAEFSKREDFKELMADAQQVPSSPHVDRAIIEFGNPAIMTYLMENPRVAIRLNRMSDAKVGAELARIDAEISGDSRRVTHAPKPPTPVKRPSPTAPKDLNDPNMSADDWVRIRNEQVRAQGRPY